MAAGAETMGRPKKGDKKKLEPVIGPDERVAIIHLKGTPAYAAWLEAANRKTHIPKAAMFRLAMEMFAKTHGLEAPPEL
jgi:hypothetical protein